MTERSADAAAAFIEREITQMRPQLLLHCYRMLGSLTDAEDAVQDAAFRAWRAASTLRDPTRVRAWVFGIATRVCLTARARRMPHDVRPAANIDGSLEPEILDRERWIEPLPDEYVGRAASPEDAVLEAESVSLAFITALQQLSPPQRACLLLTEVLDWAAAETARALQTTVPAVNSHLQRARRRLADAYPRSDAVPDVALLQALRTAWEARDAERLASILVEDVRVSMPPDALWFADRDTFIAFLGTRLFGSHGPEHMHLVPVFANRAPGFLVSIAVPPQVRPIGAIFPRARGDRISEISGFTDLRVLGRFCRGYGAGGASALGP